MSKARVEAKQVDVSSVGLESAKDKKTFGLSEEDLLWFVAGADTGLYPSEHYRDICISRSRKRGFNLFIKFPDPSGEDYFGLTCCKGNRDISGIYEFDAKGHFIKVQDLN